MRLALLRPYIVAFAAALASGSVVVRAQPADDAALATATARARAQALDVDVKGIHARAKAQRAEAGAFAREVSKRADLFRNDAVTTREGAAANRARLPATGGPKGIFDFDGLIAQQTAAQRASEGGPRLIVFASTSIPPVSLKPLLHDVSRAGGIVVFRGFKDNSVKAFTTSLEASLERGEKLSGVGIDPRLFRAFNIRVVPTFVSLGAPITPCSGLRCKTEVPAHDRLEGNVTVEYALERFAEGGGAGAPSARSYLGRLRAITALAHR